MDVNSADAEQNIPGTRRVVTGIDADGKSVILSDGTPPRSAVLEWAAGRKYIDLWHLSGPLRSPADGGDLDGYANLVAPPGGVHWRTVVLPPDAQLSQAPEDLAKLAAERDEKLPDWRDHFDPARPGMHCTQTVDFGIVLSGEVWLEVEKGEVHLKAGDCVVQRGTMHAWRNRGDVPCVMSFVLLTVGSGSAT